MSAPNLRNCWTLCDRHGKRTFVTRRAARQNIRAMGANMRAYPCDATGGWHMGHLSWLVKAGIATAAEVYGGQP